MCGFLFQYKKTKNISLDRFVMALSLQEHRGPDHQGVIFKPELSNADIYDFKSASTKSLNGQIQVAFGHQRLSIVDLSKESNQPVVSTNSGNVMLFNGEFYNFVDYADTPETKKSDTLTLFSLLEKQGLKALDDVNGMWGLCYYVAAQNKLFLARDRFGKKPVYYYQDDEQFIASSEMKSIFSLLDAQKRQINASGLAYYLLGKQTPFLNNGETFYKSIKSVKPGEVLSLDFDSFSLSHHCDVTFHVEDNFETQVTQDDKFIQNLHSDINEAIKLRLKSEVPVTILASGGVDSTWIAGIAAENLNISNNLSLYTCHNVSKSGEITEDLAYARDLAKDLSLPLHEVEVEKSDMQEFMDVSTLLTKQVELPLNLFLATIPTYLMTKSMSEQGIKVVLDGVGGDEIMGGYPSYTPLILSNMSQRNIGKAYHYFRNWKEFEQAGLGALVQMLKSCLKSMVKGGDALSSIPQQLGEVYKPYINSRALEKSMEELVDEYFVRHTLNTQKDVQLFEIEKYQLPYYLGIADQMSMMNSVENRSPYLDKNLYKYIFMPEKYKFANGYNKYALRASMPNNISDKYRWRSGKVGIGNAFSQDLITQSKPYECVMDSKFIRSLFDVNQLTHQKDLTDQMQIIRPLFSLALLDDIYGIYL